MVPGAGDKQGWLGSEAGALTKALELLSKGPSKILLPCLLHENTGRGSQFSSWEADSRETWNLASQAPLSDFQPPELLEVSVLFISCSFCGILLQ